MIDDAAYVKDLIKKQVEGKLTKEEYVEWKLAKLYYSEEDWFRLEVDAFCELEAEHPSGPPPDWRPALERAMRAERRQRRTSAIRRIGRGLAVASAVAAVITVGIRLAADNPRPADTSSARPQWARDGDIPGSEFTCTVWWGDSTSIAVAPRSRGRLGVIRNVELWRGHDGALELVPIDGALPWEDAVSPPPIRITTQAYQQCAVILPGGGYVRLDAGSTLEYSLGNPFDGITVVRLDGQAIVGRVESKGADGKARLIVQTADARVQLSSGLVSVLAERYRTRAVLLEGRAHVFSRWRDKRYGLKYVGESATMARCCTDPDGRITTTLTVACLDTDRVTAWARREREYRNVPAREYVADMSRWHGFKVESLECLPEGLPITSTMHYLAPVDEVYAELFAVGLPVFQKDGMISFCAPGINPGEPSGPLQWDRRDGGEELMERLHQRELLALNGAADGNRLPSEK